MADTCNHIRQNIDIPTGEHISESEDEYHQPESPGTRKLKHLATSHVDVDEPEVTARLLERPISSGSIDLQHAAYGAARRHDPLHIAKRRTAAVYGVTGDELCAESDNGKTSVDGVVPAPAHRQMSPMIQSPNGRHSHERDTGRPVNLGINPSDKLRYVHADHAEVTPAKINDEVRPEIVPSRHRGSEQVSVPDLSKAAVLGQMGEIVPTTRQHDTGFNIAPISRSQPRLADQPAKLMRTGEKASLSHEKACNTSASIAANVESFTTTEQNGSRIETSQVVDLTEKDGESEPVDASEDMREDNSLTHVGSPNRNENSPTGVLRQRSPPASRRGRRSVGRTQPEPKAPLQPVRSTKVAKRPSIRQQQPSGLPLETPLASTGRVPSEEDLYFLLLHRYRKREQVERQLGARLRQVEMENTELGQAAQEYQQQLETSTESCSKQAAEIRAQKMVIQDIMNSYSKIKKFMTDVYEEQKLLKTKAITIDQDRMALRNEHDEVQHLLEEANNATTSSSITMHKMKTDLTGLRQEAAHLEMSLHDAKLELRNAQDLLIQEKSRNVKYENYIVETNRKQENFSSTIQQEQQHLLSTLKSINAKIEDMETRQLVAVSPSTFPAIDQCVAMLKALTEMETAGPADVADMIQVVQGLTESIDSLQKRSEENSQTLAAANAESDKNLLSQITEHFNMLLRNSDNQDEISKLREAKITLEERIRGGESMLNEVRNSKVSAEKRENGVRASNDKLVNEFAKQRDMALTKKSSDSLSEIQSLTMKWTKTNTLLAESLQRIEAKDQQLRSDEEQIRSLSNQLSEAKVEQMKSVEEIQGLSTRLEGNIEALDRERTQLSAENEKHVRNLQDELEHWRAEHDDRLKELEQAGLIHYRLTKELDEANSQLGPMTLDSAATKTTIASLTHEVDKLREQADRVSGLIHESEAKDAVISHFQQELESLKAVNERLQGTQVHAESNAVKISELNTRLKAAEKASDELLVLQARFRKCEEEMKPLKGAQERVISLDSELQVKNDQLNELNIRIANLVDTQKEVDKLKVQMSSYKDSYESMEKSLRTTEAEAARNPVLEQQVRARDDELAELRAKLTEAEKISKAVPEVYHQVNQFSEKFDNLKHDLDDAQQIRDELESTKVTNAMLQQSVRDLQDQAAVAEKANDSMRCLYEEVQQKDAQVVALQTELARLEIESQQHKGSGQGQIEDLSKETVSQEEPQLNGICPVQQENNSHNDGVSMLGNEPVNNVSDTVNPHRKRRRADCSASSLLGKVTIIDASTLGTETAERADSGLDTAHGAIADATDGERSLIEQCVDETELVPESQPGVKESRNPVSVRRMSDNTIGNAISSSPLSDVGELFDPSDPDYSGNHQPFGIQEPGGGLPDRASVNDIGNIEQVFEGHSLSVNTDLERDNSAQQGSNSNRPSQEGRPPSSSYGEPLLFDDLEGLGSLPGNSAADLALGKLLTSSAEDVLTSPVSALPRRWPRTGTQRKTPATSTRSVNLPEDGQHLVKDPSPRRLRSSENVSETKTRQPLDEIDENTIGIPPSTPDLPMREKHQPNSAIKRKSDVANILEEAEPIEKKRTKRKLSNIEVTSRPVKGSHSFGSSTTGSVTQTLTRLRHSSASSTSTRGTIVGRNAPAPGLGRQGPKKPRGGSKSQRYNERFGSQRG